MPEEASQRQGKDRPEAAVIVGHIRPASMPTPTAAQRKAIEAERGPVLVVAGPGAGKTFCLIGRIQHAITAHRIPAARICAVTFTNKAAEEIAHRLHEALGTMAGEVTRGTLHALCHSILRAHPAAAGLAEGFGIADEDYQVRVLRRLQVPSRRYKQVLGAFTRRRLLGLPFTSADDGVLHRRYCETLRARNLVDYDDLIVLAGELLDGHADIAAQVRGKWDCILVDEFQDLSMAQYRVIRALIGPDRNCFAVGDDEQSIFSWTGADPHILERFRTDFEIEEPVVLDHNRRCSTQIFEAARRLIEWNPALFRKKIEADRESEHDVTAHAFADDEIEADWVIADMIADRIASGLDWSDYALLYRKHDVGQYLERRLVLADVPCRLAAGHALLDDDVIAYVAACLRLIRTPDDPVAMEALASRLLQRDVFETLRASGDGSNLLASARELAASEHQESGTRKALWRFIYHVGNLAALRRSHSSLGELINDLLSQPVGPIRGRLDEFAAELTDPAQFPGAPALALRLAAAVKARARIPVVRHRGIEIPVMQMLRGAGLAGVLPFAPEQGTRPDDCILSPADARPGHWPLLVFKALQLLCTEGLAPRFTNFVAFDLETTGKDTLECEVVEIAAVRVRNGVIVDQFQQLVRTDRPIPEESTRVHGYRDTDVCNSPRFAEVWPRFREFVGTDLLVAHNGYEFDVPVLRRVAGGLPGIEALTFFDTLPLARALCPGSAKLEHLARKFGVHAGRGHHALDDAAMLVGVALNLNELELARARTTVLARLLPSLGLALAVNGLDELTAEEQLLLQLARPGTLGRFSNVLEDYAEAAAGTDAPGLAEIIARLGGEALMRRLRTERSPADRYPEALERLGALVAASSAHTLEESIDLLLARAALSAKAGAEVDSERVNLLTLHSTKGLEFSRVYVIGAEDGLLPGQRELDQNDEKAIQEGRRLLYVGMTRAQDRLVLTRVERRLGQPGGGALFLSEAGLSP